jgi:hypothetical protein
MLRGKPKVLKCLNFTLQFWSPPLACVLKRLLLVFIYTTVQKVNTIFQDFFFFFLFFVSLDFILRNYIQLLINRDMLFSPLLFLHVLRNHTLGYIINRLQTQNFTQYIYIYIYIYIYAYTLLFVFLFLIIRSSNTFGISTFHPKN